MAWYSSVIVREKSEQGGGLESLSDGEDHNPGTQSDKDIKTLFLVINELLSLILTSQNSVHNYNTYMNFTTGGGKCAELHVARDYATSKLYMNQILKAYAREIS